VILVISPDPVSAKNLLDRVAKYADIKELAES
jgi:hypothetical protein